MPVALTCQGCGLTFFVPPSHQHQKFCGQVCKGIARRRPLAERFWSKVDRSDNASCWVWIGDRHDHGYGRLWQKSRKPLYAHRVAWELAYGPIPEGMEVLHKCDNPPCCRHDHLFLGDQKANNADRDRKDRVRHGEMHPSARLTQEQVDNIKQTLLPAGVSYAAIGRIYGLDPGIVADIANGRTWRRVKEQRSPYVTASR